MFKKVLVCLDGSGLAEQILPCVTEQALCCRSKLALLQVINLPSTISAGIEAVPMPVPLDQVQREEAEAKAYLERVAQPLRGKGLEVQCITLLGSPGESIVSYADENGFGLIALVTHGRSGLGRLVFGSVTDFVVRRSGLPIMLIKPK